jgi:hypothetical protein
VGLLCDYLRASDTGSVAKLMARTGGHSPLTVLNGQTAVDGVEAKNIEPNVAVGKVVAMVLGLELVLHHLSALARRACATEQRLYCWVSL